MNNKLCLKQFMSAFLVYILNSNAQANNLCQSYLIASESLVSKIQDLTNSSNISLDTHVEKLKTLDALYSTIQNDSKNIEAIKIYVKVSNLLSRKNIAFAKRHLEVLANLITLEGPTDENLNLLYDSLVENKKFTEAESVAKMLISRNPQNPSYGAKFLYAIKRQGRFTEMIDFANTILRNHPDHIETIDLIVQAHLELARQLKKYDTEKANDHLNASKDLLKQLVRQNLASSKHYIQLGQIFYSLGQYQEILDLLELAAYTGIEVQKDQATILKIRAYTRLDDFSLAEDLLESLYYQNPEAVFIQNLKSWFRDYLSKYNRKQKQLRLSHETNF